MPELDPTPRPTRHARRTGRFGRGEAMVWLLGAALVLNLIMIASLLTLIAVQGLRAFWPAPVHMVTLQSGEHFLGAPVRTEAYHVPVEQRRRLQDRLRDGQIDPDAVTPEGLPVRRLYRTGNRDLGTPSFRWESLGDIAATETPPDAVFVERVEWGVFLGVPEAIVLQELHPAQLDEEGRPVLGGPPDETAIEEGRPLRLTREIRAVEVAPGDIRPHVLTRRYLTDGPEATWGALRSMLPPATDRRERIRELQRSRIGPVNAAMNHLRERLSQARLDLARAEAGLSRSGLTTPVWLVVLALGAAGVVGGLVTARRARAGARQPGPGVRILVRALVVAGAGLLVFAWLERPAGPQMSPERLAQVSTEVAERQAELEARYDSLAAELAESRREDDRYRVIIRDPASERFAPERQSAPDEPMRISQIVRVFQPNTLGTSDRIGIYLSRWWEFLSDDPREANTEGGVFPVVFGTVLLTILLTIVVVPLGVIAALYLREYAKQGLATSVIRIAVNNLAGVPSIVYGVFGLGFFCYTVGAYVDRGPAEGATLPHGRWWVLLMAGLALVLLATTLGVLGVGKPGRNDTLRLRTIRNLSVAAWIGAFGMVAAMLVTTPYFHGFFEARLPDPTFGKRGLLWASLTLALLTLPVVIVSTEEAIAAVQPSLREGSYGCGASKWQTIRRIVLPGAMPGILTGMILAMARGAGEVAPLMLVGALKWAPELPVSLEPPFLHLDRSFMHLGFHIFDLGFQSPDSEAAKPLVWTSTLLLIAVILLLNLTAISLRARVRRRMGSGHF
jgi:phosphate transport system permease protein